MKTVTLYTDGACSGNPGPGGWGAILEYEGHKKELSGGEANTTNNRMELTAVIRGLEALKESCAVTPTLLRPMTSTNIAMTKGATSKGARKSECRTGESPRCRQISSTTAIKYSKRQESAAISHIAIST